MAGSRNDRDVRTAATAGDIGWDDSAGAPQDDDLDLDSGAWGRGRHGTWH